MVVPAPPADLPFPVPACLPSRSQRPYLVAGTLRDQLLYPEPPQVRVHVYARRRVCMCVRACLPACVPGCLWCIRPSSVRACMSYLSSRTHNP